MEEPSTAEEPRSDFKTPSKKKTISVEELTRVYEAFKSDIETQCSPGKLWVKRVLKADETFKKSELDDKKIKPVSHWVWYLIKRQQLKDSYELPEESVHHRTARYVLLKPPGTSSVGGSEPGRWEWSEEEMAIIKCALKDFKKVPRNTDICKIFQSFYELINIFNANTFERI